MDSLNQNTPRRPIALELGAGCGLTAIALALAGFDVLASDKASTVGLLKTNVARFAPSFEGNYEEEERIKENRLRGWGSVDTAVFDWCSLLPPAFEDGGIIEGGAEAAAEMGAGASTVERNVDFMAIEAGLAELMHQQRLRQREVEEKQEVNSVEEFGLPVPALVVLSDCIYVASTVQPLMRVLQGVSLF